MKASWITKLLCFIMIAALAAQCTAVAFAFDTMPEVYYRAGGEADEDGNWTPEYWVDSRGNRVSEPSARVRAASDLPRQYDLRDENAITSVKHQGGSGGCWSFSAIASLESSYIRQGYGTLENTDFSEAHLTWFSQRQRTPDRNDPTYGDGQQLENPFVEGGNWNFVAATLMRGSGLQLEANAPWIVAYDANTLMQMQQNESDRYVSYARMWSVSSIRDNSLVALKQKLMQNGAVVVSYYDDYYDSKLGFNSEYNSYYQTEKVGKTNHVVTVVGWDDDFPRTYFRPNGPGGTYPKQNGALLIKGSWSTLYGDGGYYWISYEDPSLCEMASFVAAKEDIYDHIYQYDGAYPSISFPVPNTGKMANVFTAKRTEILTHVAFYSSNEDPISATAEIYLAPDDFQPDAQNPIKGMQKVDEATTTVTGVEYGYSTMELNTPVPLKQGQKFTVVLTMTLKGANKKVRIPVEGEGLTKPPVTYGGNPGESYIYYGGYWYDTNEYPSDMQGHTTDYNNVPLKAMTQDVTLTDPTLRLMAPPEKTSYRVGDAFDPKGMMLAYTDEYGITQVVTEGYTCEPKTLSEIGPQTVTVKYNGLIVSVDVSAEPFETSLSLWMEPDKTTYRVGDTLDTSGMILLYKDEYGRSYELDSGFTCEPTTLSEIGTQAVRVTYNGHSVSFNVTVEPYETAMMLLTPPDKTTYYVRETLDPTGLSLWYLDEYGMQNTVTEDFICSPQTLRTIGQQTVTVTYKGHSATFDVTVEPYAPTLTLLTPPDKTTYLFGETLDPAGLSLRYTDEYGDAFVADQDYACTPTTLSALGTQTVTAVYNGLSVQFDVTVEPLEPTLTLLTPPDKTTYYVGETIDTTGLSLQYTNGIGEASIVTEGFTCEPATLPQIGTQTVTVTYGGLSVQFDVTAEPYEPTLTLLTPPDKTTFFIGETLETAGLTLLYTDEYGAQYTVSEGFDCDVETLSEIGTQTVRVTYKALSVRFNVTVEPLDPTLKIKTAADKTVYFLGETLDTTELSLVYTNRLGTAQIVTEGFTCSPTVLSELGTQTITVTYNGLTAEYDVLVKPYAPVEPTLSVETLPDKTTYLISDTLDTTGLSLRYRNVYDTVKTVTKDFVCTPTTFTALGEQTVTVTYKGLSTTFAVTVEPLEPTLTLEALPDKTTYLAGETLDPAGLTLLYTDEYGTPYTVTRGFACSPTTLPQIGTQTVTVTYNGLSEQFDVTVEPHETTLSIKTMPDKTTYRVLETLDTTGLTLRYTDEYGVPQTVSEGFVCSVQTLRAIGTQSVSVAYKGLSASFDVTVEPYEPTLTLFSAPNKTVYLYGETLNPTGLSLTYTDAYGDALAVTEGFVCTPSTFLALGTQTVTVAYEGLTAQFDVTVEPHAPTLTLLTPPTKSTYRITDTLDTTGLSLLYTDEYADTHTVTEGIVCDVQTFTEPGVQSVTATYNDLTVSFDVTVELLEPTLTIRTLPETTTYSCGETLDLTGLELIYTNEYGVPQTVTQGYTCEPETLSALGTQTVTVAYNGLSVQFDVTVEPLEPTLTLQFAPTVTDYMVGDTLDTTGLTLFYTDERGSALIVTEGFVCDVTKFTEVGAQTVTVTYNGLSVTFDVNVTPFVAFQPTLTVTHAPDKITYLAGETLDTTGLVLEYMDERGKTSRVTSGYTCDLQTLRKVGAVTVTVTYAGVSSAFDVTVEPRETKLSLKTAPAKTTYFVGETLDTKGLSLDYSDELGDSYVVTEGFTCTPEKLLKAGRQTVTVTFRDRSVTFDVTVRMAEAVSLQVTKAPTNTSFTYKSTPNFSGLTVTVRYSDGREEMVNDLSKMKIEPASTTRVRNGTQKYKVTVDGASATFDMQVRLQIWQRLILIFLLGFLWY